MPQKRIWMNFCPERPVSLLSDDIIAHLRSKRNKIFILLRCVCAAPRPSLFLLSICLAPAEPLPPGFRLSPGPDGHPPGLLKYIAGLTGGSKNNPWDRSQGFSYSVVAGVGFNTSRVVSVIPLVRITMYPTSCRISSTNVSRSFRSCRSWLLSSSSSTALI